MIIDVDAWLLGLVLIICLIALMTGWLALVWLAGVLTLIGLARGL